MRAFITGAAGMMGSHLLDFLAEKNVESMGIDIKSEEEFPDKNLKAHFVQCDVRDMEKLTRLMIEFKPDVIFHLAAQPHPIIAWEKPQYTADVNIIGSINVFEIVKKHLPHALIVSACTSAEYGYVDPSEVPVKESKPLRPINLYGVTKVAQELLAYQYWYNFKVRSISLRIFNTTGPRKINDALSDWTRQVAKIEKGLQEPVIRVGNLTTRRAITDVRDLIEACWLAATKGEVGGVYNVSGAHVYLMEDALNILKKISRVPFTVFQDPKLMRPSDEPIIYGDSSKFKKQTGWSQNISLEKTLTDMVDYWRARDDDGKSYI